MFYWKKLFLLFVCIVLTQPVLADSAEAWKAYQEGRNPLMEVGLLVVGVVVFFGLLVLVNKAMERSKNKKHKKNSKSKRGNR